MKILFTSIFILFFTVCFSQNIEDSKQISLIHIYGNKQKKLINYDKSFVSDDRLFYESLSTQNPWQISERKLIEKVLGNYMEGSSYNKLDILENSFSPNATLYLTTRTGFTRYTPKEYVNFFKNGKVGEFNGRKTKILTIEIVNDIATAKVEVSISARKMVYIDLFLLKKLENGWKIISKTATRINNEE